MTTAKAPKYHVTDNYKLFEFHELNREVRYTKEYRNLKQLMVKQGFNPASPIEVVPNGGGKYLIINGHRRFDIAQSLGIPIVYYVSRNKHVEPWVEGETVQKWVLRDYIGVYKTKQPDYAELEEFSREYGITITTAAGLLVGNVYPGNYQLQDLLRRGEFRIKNRKNAEIIAFSVKELAQINGCARNRAFVIALAKCYRVPLFDINLFVEKTRKHTSMFLSRANVDEYVTLIESIYNWKSRNPIPLAFEAAQLSKRKDEKIN